jgi:purine-binding chemotaxis protein CheW
MTRTTHYCTFHLGELMLGIPVADVQEVVKSSVVTRVPLAPAIVRGLMNLRGQIVTVIDLRRRLNLPTDAAPVQDVNVVIAGGSGMYSFGVDSIGDVVELEESSFDDTLIGLQSGIGDPVSGVRKLKDRLVLILDAARIPATAQT